MGRHHPLHLEPRPLDHRRTARSTPTRAEDADAWTGNAYLRDVTVTADLTPLAGSSHLVAARVQGTSRFYAAGFDGDDVVIVKEDHGTTVLARAPVRPHA